jgi:hypothetical protein
MVNVDNGSCSSELLESIIKKPYFVRDYAFDAVYTLPGEETFEVLSSAAVQIVGHSEMAGICESFALDWLLLCWA